jgi:hypothetical protein
MSTPNFLRKTLNQIHRCYENKYASGHKVFVSQFGNLNSDGFFIYYELGVDTTYWKEIPYEDFSKACRPEAIDLVEFITKHKRLPNYTMSAIPYEYGKHFP